VAGSGVVGLFVDDLQDNATGVAYLQQGLGLEHVMRPLGGVYDISRCESDAKVVGPYRVRIDNLLSMFLCPDLSACDSLRT
jgi:hypothetical protein